jgi:hypothetical protein
MSATAKGREIPHFADPVRCRGLGFAGNPAGTMRTYKKGIDGTSLRFETR